MAAAGLADVGHVVTPGENLAVIAARYDTTPQAIARANHIANPNLVVIGTRLTIPTSPTPVPPPAAAPSPQPHAAAAPGIVPLVPLVAPRVTYTVRAGDNLTVIAARFGVTAAALAAANGIGKPNRLRGGQVLSIPVPSPAAVQALLVRYARSYQLDPPLIEALAWQESGWQQEVISGTGAVGVMQIMPGTGTFTGQVLLLRPVDIANLQRNVEAGVAFFAYLLRQARGDVSLAVAGYYQGLRSVRQKGMLSDTRRYVADVLALKQRFAA